MFQRTRFETIGFSTLSWMWRCLFCLVTCVSFSGCGSEAYVPSGKEAEHLRQLAVNYMQFITMNNGQSPPSEAIFKQFIVRRGHDRAKLEEMFVSPRDSKPYVVAYNVPITGSSAVIIAYEQDGVDGTRYVAFDDGGVEIADEERFKLLVPNAKAADSN
ncbi:MAG: hypothetical protein JXM70_26145 [Pirellulales bacterium]|nr:hypothetical protein [Pirellulales bacterium]